MEYSFLAYIGPGAGFAFTGAFLATFATIASVIMAFLMVSLRRAVKAVRHRFRRPDSPPKAIIIGFDGMDPRIVQSLLQHNRLPNMRRLMESGTFSGLESTIPPLSPVAWSSLITGVNPGKHNVYDFLRRDPASYRILPALATLDDFTHPRSKGKLYRKSIPFWHLLSKASIPSFIFRVPATFPVEPFDNLRLLAGMGIPDLRGTQGLYTCFESVLQSPITTQNGERIPFKLRNNCLEGILTIKDADNEWTVNISLKPEGNSNSVRLSLPGHSIMLKPREFSEWIRIPFRKGLFNSFYGIARFCLLSGFPNVRLYVSPLHIDPSRPVIQLSVPSRYSIELADEHGLFGTLGMAEDTSAFMDGVLDQDLFLKQTYDLQAEREKIFLDEIRQAQNGFCMGVFDFTDRIQHMFFGGNTNDYPWENKGNNQSDIIATAYERADEFLGKILAATNNKSLVFILSDHGFEHFRKGFNLNAWLQQNGLLATTSDNNEEYLQNIDWEATKAYAFGLNSLFLNRIGREGKGIVSDAEADSLIRSISENLLKIKAPETGQAVISNVYSARETYHGPYLENSPDLIIGYAPGYRVSWQSGRGGIGNDLFESNNTRWTGDHSMDPRHVPGVFLCNHKFNPQKQTPRLTDIAPTILNAFNIPVPDYMDGQIL